MTNEKREQEPASRVNVMVLRPEDLQIGFGEVMLGSLDGTPVMTMAAPVGPLLLVTVTFTKESALAIKSAIQQWENGDFDEDPTDEFDEPA